MVCGWKVRLFSAYIPGSHGFAAFGYFKKGSMM
jgi:hypothetical protein